MAYPTRSPDLRGMDYAQPTRMPVYVSKIPPRGYRPPRKPKDFSTFDKSSWPTNIPLLNEMAENDPRVIWPDNPRAQSDEKALTEKYIKADIERYHKLRMDFFAQITKPPSELPMPKDPVLPQISEFSIHKDVVYPPVSGPIFSVKQLDEIPSFTQDDQEILMHGHQKM